MKVKSIKPVGVEPTWDVTTDTETYVLSNGCISHNTSSRVQNLTNGIEPIRNLITSKDGICNVAPEAEKLKNKYVSAWDVDVEGYLKVVSVLQKWMDQAISTNTTYDPSKFPDEKIPGSLVLRHLLLGYKWGVKTFYYNNNVKSDNVVDKQDEVCDSCVL